MGSLNAISLPIFNYFDGAIRMGDGDVIKAQYGKPINDGYQQIN